MTQDNMSICRRLMGRMVPFQLPKFRRPLTKFFYLLDLPNEIIVLICQYLTSENDINNFSRCNHRLHELLTPDLYRHNIRHFAGSALVWAAENGQANTVETMLKCGADPNRCLQPYTRRTPLAIAALTDDLTIPKLLLASGKCLVDKSDAMGATALSLAVSRNKPSLVGLLLRHGSSANIGHPEQNPLRIAIYCRHAEIVQLILAQASVDVNAKVYDQMPLLIYAVQWGSLEVLAPLLARKDLDVNITDIAGETALMIAARDGNLQAVKALLARGALPHAVNHLHQSALFFATESGRDEIISTLLDDRRVHIESPSAVGLTPLMVAALHGQASTVRLLLALGANANRQDHFGYSPLSIAAAHGRSSVVSILLDTNGVNPQVRCRNGRTPLSLAVSGKIHPHLEADVPDFSDVVEVILMLLSTTGVDPDAKDHDGRTPLSYAVGMRSVYLVKTFLDQPSVNPDSRDIQDRTPLFYSALQCCSHSRHQYYPVHWHRECAVARLLLDTGHVNVNAQDQYGRTALWYAHQQGCQGLVKMLKEKKAVLNPGDMSYWDRMAISRVKSWFTPAKKWVSRFSH